MRIISGVAKGTKLQSVPGQATRPTGDRIKESLFNILGNQVYGSTFLDLYAGNGGIGLEALSRGAQSVIWVDTNPLCTKMIRINLEKSKLQNGRIITNDVFRALNQLALQGSSFDYVFLDPPYEQGYVAKTLLALDQTNLLKKEGIIIVEASKKEDAPQAMSKLCLRREQRYGNTILYFYQNEEDFE